MRAQEKTVLNIIGGLDKVFIIPPFQRNYDWNFEQCDELFEDIINSYKTKKSHYLGNIVYYLGKNNGAAFNEIILVDGQQRITTILLLLCAIRDTTTNETTKRNIENRYLINDDTTDHFRMRLKQTSYDTQSFVSIVNKLPIENKNSKIFKNYNHFIELINQCDLSPEEIYETIPKLEMVDVNLQIEDDLGAVQTVFEKINSTGKRLSPADLIRNYLLLANSAIEQESLYQNYWVQIENSVKNDNISRFARDFLIMNIFEDVPESSIYKMFKAHFTETQATHVSILNEMYHLSKYYAWIKFESCPNEKINRLISTLNFLKTDDIYPLYLFLFSKLYESNSSVLREILELIFHFMLRYRIVAPSGGGGAIRSVVHQLLEKLNSEQIELSYDNIYFELSNSSAISGRFPDDNEFKETLMKSVNINYARVLLLQIEEYETKNISVPLSKVTVEHLMPQTLTDWWTDNLGGSEETARIHDVYLNCIGNLTPMSGGYNSKNSNKPWHIKQQHIREVQFRITSEIACYNKWTEDEIKQRNEDIANRACCATTSPLPRTRKIQTKIVSEEFKPGLYPITDITTPMNNTRITEILFEDSVIKVGTWKEFLKVVCEIAYEFDNVLFANTVKENKIHKATSKKNYPDKDPIISQNPDLLLEAKRIKDTNYYVEGCISSNRARVYADQLLGIYGISDAFQINVEQ